MSSLVSGYLGLNPTQLLLSHDWGQIKSAVTLLYYKMKNIILTLFIRFMLRIGSSKQCVLVGVTVIALDSVNMIFTI